MTTYDAAVAYDAAIPWDGVAADRTPSDHCRIEVAFTTSPDDPNPAWVDLTSRGLLTSGVTITRGRGDEFATTQAGTMSLTLENIDGALTPGLTASPFYPTVLPQRRIRLTYRDPNTLGKYNLLSAEDASFEGGTVGNWSAGAGGATIANDTTHADVGTKALRITWPTAAGATSVPLTLSGLVIGRTYTIRARVWSATGVPDIRVNVGSSVGTPTSTKNAFADILNTFTATTNTMLAGVQTASASTSGQQTWVDGVMLDEGTTLGAFTTTQPDASVIVPKFDGYVDEWPVEWPDGADHYAASTITATDLIARIDARQKLRSVVVETMALDNPVVQFPLGEAQDSTTVASIVGSTPSTLTVQQHGTGGTITFASGTGVPTDGLSAPVFAPAGPSDGKCLSGTIPTVGSAAAPVGLVASFKPSSAISTTNTIAQLSNSFGDKLSINIDATGHLLGSWNVDSVGTTGPNITSGTSTLDGSTHDGFVVITQSAGTLTLKLYLDGVSVSSTTSTTHLIQPLDRLTIGDNPSVSSSTFAGTVSHVAVFKSDVLVARALEQYLSKTSGFAGERSDQRIARIASWIGLPAARQNLDVGNSASVGHLDCTGLSPLEYMRKIELTEAGLLFAGRDGRLTFYNRARSESSAAPALTVPAYMVQSSARLAENLLLVKNDITGSRVNGAMIHMFDATSRTAYGPLEETIDVVTTSDDDVALAVGWRLNMSKTPLVRFTNLELDAYTDSTYSPQILSLTDIGVRVELTGMPAQAPASTLRQTVQGYTETIGDSGWNLAVNATPYDQMVALVLDDPTYGLLDSFPIGY